MRKAAALLTLMIAAGCGQKSAAPSPEQGAGPVASTPAPAPAEPAPEKAGPLPTDAWIGRWIGVEGLALDIQPGDAPGDYNLMIARLDATDDYPAKADGDVIRFERAGVSETIRKATGAQTGLKWLAGKQDCLMIKSGEGFCRD